MGGFIIYDNFIHKDNSIENRNLKLDNNKDWVYDASYDLPTDKDSYYGYS